MADSRKIAESDARSPQVWNLVRLSTVILTVLILAELAFSAGPPVSRTGASIPLPAPHRDQRASELTITADCQGRDQTQASPTLVQKEDERRRSHAALDEEKHLMREIVQTLDRESAAQWLSGFVSSRPWSCPLQQRDRWIDAVLNAVERNQLPLCKEILGLVTTLISIESGFHADPLVGDPSRRGSMEGLLKRAEGKLFDEYGPLLAMPPIPKYYATYKDSYWPQLLTCRTESEVEKVARRLADDLKKDAEHFPAAVRSVVDQKIGKLAHIVRSKGSMQLKLFRARSAMRNRGEDVTDEELTEYLYTVDGGVDVGVAALKPMFIQYAARYAKKGDLSWLYLVGMDYHYGPFASRNMMEQIRLRDLSGLKIAIDGSFLNHGEEGRPEQQDSDTLLAAVRALPSRSKQEIFQAFLLEREPHYIYTDVHRAIERLHAERFGATPFAVSGYPLDSSSYYM